MVQQTANATSEFQQQVKRYHKTNEKVKKIKQNSELSYAFFLAFSCKANEAHQQNANIAHIPDDC